MLDKKKKTFGIYDKHSVTCSEEETRSLSVLFYFVPEENLAAKLAQLDETSLKHSNFEINLTFFTTKQHIVLFSIIG